MSVFAPLFSISPSEVSCARRGFPDDVPGACKHLERAGGAFVTGYNAALRTGATAALFDRLDALPPDLHGFAHEGAAMALALLDLLTPWSRRRWRWLIGERPAHLYLCFVGAGWALARLRRRAVPAWIAAADPLLAPLALDGLGFHESFFHPERVRAGAASPFAGYDGRAFDQGMGRSLWFVGGANGERIVAMIGNVARPRRADLWSGAGLALAYAGGPRGDEAGRLAGLSGEWCDHLAQGVAFAAKARVRAGNVTTATELACREIWRANPESVAAVVDEALEATPAGLGRYERWREAVRIAWSDQDIGREKAPFRHS
jgi:enediyne biosynthesis protein E3